MSFISRLLFIFIFSYSFQTFGQITGSYTIDCIINGNCATSGDHISLEDIISDTDILSWKEGHGGYAVEYRGQTFVMDFIENGIGNTAYFDASITADQNILSHIESNFYNESNLFHEKLAQKLTEIDGYSSELAFAYLAGIMSYNWVFVDFDLKPTPDIDTVASLPGAIYTPLANRRQQTILIHSPSWKKLDLANKVGLIIHELNYSLIVPTFDRMLSTNLDMRRGSLKARELTAYLFQPLVKVKKVRGFNTVSNNFIDFTFGPDRYDLSRLIWNNDGSATLPIGKSFLEVQTQILKFDNPNVPILLKWGSVEKDRVQDQFNINALCARSRNAISNERDVTINFYHTVRGNLKLKFNVSEVSSLEIHHSNDLQTSDSWMFSFSLEQASKCESRIRDYILSI